MKPTSNASSIALSHRTPNQRSGLAFLSVITASFLITALTAHPAELPPQPLMKCTAALAA